jgi:hypothetical protein
VLAVVDGTSITEDDVRKAAGLEIARLEEQLYQLRKQQVDDLIARRLLDAEATRRGLSVACGTVVERTSRGALDTGCSILNTAGVQD